MLLLNRLFLKDYLWLRLLQSNRWARLRLYRHKGFFRLPKAPEPQLSCALSVFKQIHRLIESFFNLQIGHLDDCFAENVVLINIFIKHC